MRCSLLPVIDAAHKESLKLWLTEVLRHPRLGTTTRRYPLGPDQICVYVDSRTKLVQYGTWQMSGSVVYVGGDGSEMALTDRLGILAGIISAAGLWDELTELYSTAVSKALLETYNEM